MQGIFRYALAHLVVLGHLWLQVWDHPVAHPGVYAVFSFYLLSGYLMALTLSRTYPYTLRGTLRFFGNRALRIYPPYLCVLAATVALLSLGSPDGFHVNPFLKLPDSAAGWARNVAIFGLGGDLFAGGGEARRLVPPAWSLDVELCFYLAMGLLLARRRWIAILWLGVSLVYTLHLFIDQASWTLRYSPVAAASLPFSVGAVLYHFRDGLIRAVDEGAERMAPRLGVSAAAVRSGQALAVGLVYVVHAIVAGRLWDDPMDAGFYLSLALTAYLLLCLSGLRVEEVPRRWAAVDRFLGNLSYPVFLCHWLAALLVSAVAFGGRHPGGSVLFFSSLLVVNVLAFAIHAAVERPIERVRSAVRPR